MAPGTPVGHYQDDALVVDTIGFNDKSWLDNFGHPHSDAMHTVERFHRVSHEVLQLDLTVEDPKAYTMTAHGQESLQIRARLSDGRDDVLSV